MRKILVLPVLFLLITLIPNFMACPGNGGDDDSAEGTPSSTDTAPMSALAIEFSDLDFSHTVGTTDCPQPIGTVTLTNSTDTEATFTTELTGDGAAFIYLDPLQGAVPPGDTMTLDVFFNCGQPSSFTASLEVSLTNGAKTNTRSEQITATISN